MKFKSWVPNIVKNDFQTISESFNEYNLSKSLDQEATGWLKGIDSATVLKTLLTDYRMKEVWETIQKPKFLKENFHYMSGENYSVVFILNIKWALQGDFKSEEYTAKELQDWGDDLVKKLDSIKTQIAGSRAGIIFSHPLIEEWEKYKKRKILEPLESDYELVDGKFIPAMQPHSNRMELKGGNLIRANDQSTDFLNERCINKMINVFENFLHMQKFSYKEIFEQLKQDLANESSRIQKVNNRKTKNTARNIFIRKFTDYMLRYTGMPRRKIVALLTQVIFSLENFSETQVRKIAPVKNNRVQL